MYINSKQTKYMLDIENLVQDIPVSEMYIESLKNIPKSKGGKKEVRWGAIIPLIGGFPIGMAKDLNILPEYILSYPGYEHHDSNITNYWPSVPYYQVDGEDNRTIISKNLKLYEENDPHCLVEKKGHKKCKHKSVDIMVGTPPCAGLSMLNAQANNAAVRGSEAEVNKWIFMSTDYVLNEVKPKVYLIENAPNAFSKMGRPLADKLREQVEKVGYKLQLFKTSTHLHGLPQARQRTFYVITKGHIPRLVQDVSNRPDLTVFLNKIPKGSLSEEQIEGSRKHFERRVMLKWINELGYTLEDFIKSDQATFTGFLLSKDLLKKAIEVGKKYATVEETKLQASKRSAAAGDLRSLMHVQTKIDMIKGWWDNTPLNFLQRGYTSAIIAKQFDRIVHPDLDRFLTMDEDKLLMGLPLDFEVVSKNHNHIAQNVPSYSAAAIGRVAIKFCKGELEKTSWDFARYRNDTDKYIEIIQEQTALF